MIIKDNLIKAIGILLITLLFFSTSLSTFGQWYWQNPIPTGATYEDLTFVDDNTGWAVGTDGTIIHTADGGNTWSIQHFEPSFIFLGVHFINHLDGWVCGMDFTKGGGIILSTNNGGISWVQQDCQTNFPLYSIEFLDSNIGWAGGGDLFYTEDAGNTWIKVLSYNSSYVIFDICFINQDIGWACGSFGYILNTDDGGNNWAQIGSGTIDDFNSVDFIDTQNGWFVGEAGIVLNTIDGGQSLTFQNSTTTKDLNGVSFINPNEGWSVGNGGVIILTEYNTPQNSDHGLS